MWARLLLLLLSSLQSAAQTHYEVLGVPPSAKKPAIKSAYYKLAKQLHRACARPIHTTVWSD